MIWVAIVFGVLASVGAFFWGREVGFNTGFDDGFNAAAEQQAQIRKEKRQAAQKLLKELEEKNPVPQEIKDWADHARSF